jgi:epoxyqueuosine reductase
VIKPKDIKDFGESIGIDQVRIATAEPFDKAFANFQTQRKKGLFTDRRHRHFEHIEDFYNASTKLTQARSIISACNCYLTDEKNDLSEPGDPHGLIARYTWRNHYKGLRKKLKKLTRYIRDQTNAQCREYSNGPIAEKPGAVRSGLGFYGKHSIVINETYGSWIVLGEIITDLELESDDPLDIDCGDCTKCIDACPTRAIIAPYIIDRRLCIQELTNWLGVLPDNIADVWGKRLYGCTVCQDVCPMNSKVKAHGPRSDPGYVGPSISLTSILDMEENEYREKYKNNQITARWINFRALKRNALICLGNIGDRKFLDILERFKRSNDEIYVPTAQWAIKKIIDG